MTSASIATGWPVSTDCCAARHMATDHRPSAALHESSPPSRIARTSIAISIFQFEYFAGNFVDWDFLNLLAIERPQRKLGVQRAVHRAAPGGPKRALRAGDLYGLMMFERGQSLRNDGIGSAREMDDRA